MSSQKIPGVGRINVGRITDYSITKTGLLCRDERGDIAFHVPCAPEHCDRLIDVLYDARFPNSPQIDFSFMEEKTEASKPVSRLP